MDGFLKHRVLVDGFQTGIRGRSLNLYILETQEVRRPADSGIPKPQTTELSAMAHAAGSSRIRRNAGCPLS